MSSDELSELYDLLIDKWSHIKPYVDKDYVIEKTIANGRKHMNPNLKGNPRSYYAAIIKSYIIAEFGCNRKRIDREIKINQILDSVKKY